MTKPTNEVQWEHDQYQAASSVENALALIKAVRKRTAEVVLSALTRKDEFQIYALSVFGKEDVFIEYLFSRPRALGYEMPLEILVDDTGVQIIMDELLRIEHGILS